MNKEKLDLANKMACEVHDLERASERVNSMRGDQSLSLDFDFFCVRISATARKHILALAQADIDAQLRDAKAAFEAL